MLRKSTATLALAFLLASSFLALAASPARAAGPATITLDGKGCAYIGGSWDSGDSICTLNVFFTVNDTTTFTIPSGNDLLIGNSGGLLNYGSGIGGPYGIWVDGFLENHGTVSTFDQGTIFVDSGGIFTNDWYVNNEGTSAYGLTIDGGEFDNNHVLNNYQSATIFLLTSGSVFNNNGGATINNHGTVDNGEQFSNAGIVNNYGFFINSQNADNKAGGVFNNEQGASLGGTGTFTNEGTVFNDCNAVLVDFPSGPNYVNDQCDSSIFNALSTGLGNLATSIESHVDNSINSAVTSIESDITSAQSALSAQITTLSDSLASDYTALSTAISNIGRIGPTVGTSNDATVATSPSFSTLSSFSTSSSNWVLVSSGSGQPDRVVSGYVVSLPSGATNGILYVSLSNTPAGAGSAYAIPLGSFPGSLSPPSGYLRFPFHVPAGTSVYVQVVSGKGSTVTVQLQFESLPING